MVEIKFFSSWLASEILNSLFIRVVQIPFWCFVFKLHLPKDSSLTLSLPKGPFQPLCLPMAANACPWQPLAARTPLPAASALLSGVENPGCRKRSQGHTCLVFSSLLIPACCQAFHTGSKCTKRTLAGTAACSGEPRPCLPGAVVAAGLGEPCQRPRPLRAVRRPTPRLG